MTCTLVLTSALERELYEVALLPDETAGVLLARVVAAPNGDIRLLGQEIVWAPACAYLERRPYALAMASNAYVPALSIAEKRGCMAFWVHTHPGEFSAPVSSVHDDHVDEQLADLFRLRADARYYGSLIVSPRGTSIAFSAALFPEVGPKQRIERMWIVGGSVRLISAFDGDDVAVPDIYDRNVRAFGAPIQAALGQLRVGVVGAGGTGSAVCEQLVRLGVRHLRVFDPDVLTASNITRVYGSTPADIGRPKVDVVRDHLQKIAPDLDCVAFASSITFEMTAHELIPCDVIFGCTDDNAGRLVLSRFMTFMLTTVIDLGVLLSSDTSGTLIGIDGRITVLTPGAACLICRNRIDLRRAAAEMHTPEERLRLADEGYAPALGRVEPAVVAFTTAVAAAAVAELLERMIGYGPQPRPSEVLLRWHEREMSTNIVLPREGHYCHLGSGKVGLGDTVPFLEQTWTG